MVLSANLQHNKELNAFKLLKRAKGTEHAKSKSGTHSLSAPSAPASPAPVTRKYRSRSHIPLPTSSTLSPVLLVRKHVKKAGEGDAHDLGMMDGDVADSPPPIVVADSSSSSKHAIRLPRQLKKSATMATVDVAALQALDPELKNVPIEYVLDKLRMMGGGMLQAACSTTAQTPTWATNCLPRELELLIHTTSFAFPPPSHIFAVYSRTPNDQDIPPTKPKKVTLHPAHGIILTAHCANLPPLPTPERHTYSEPTSDPESTASSSSLKLPITPLSLPSPNTFPLLLAYLYTKQPQNLFAVLLPPTQPSLTLSNPTPTTTSSESQPPFLQSPTHLARTLAQTYTTQALLAHAARVHGLWANMVALGVSDELLWRVVQIAWAILIAALKVGISTQ